MKLLFFFDETIAESLSHPPPVPESMSVTPPPQQYLENSHPPPIATTLKKVLPQSEGAVSNEMLLSFGSELNSLEAVVAEYAGDSISEHEHTIYAALDLSGIDDLEASLPTSAGDIEELPEHSGSIIKAEKQEWLTAAGIAPDDWQYVDFIVRKESNWQPFVWNKQGSSAYGLCQTMMSLYEDQVAEDFMTNPVSQLKWCHAYALSRYGSWQKAHTFWKNNGWW